MRGKWARALLAAVACSLVAPTAASAEYSVRVGPEYFGVNYPLIHFDSDPVREAQLRAISAAGIGTVRAALSWAAVEPEAPTGVHTYDWRSSDKLVGELAAHGLKLSPAFLYTPDWAAPKGTLTCQGQAVSMAPVRPGDYALAAAALARRYGPAGSFWSERPGLPKTPITTWEIWNEPNLRTYWCPNPDPPAYAALFSHAAAAIHGVDRDARVVTSGLVLADRQGAYMGAGEFYARMGPDVWSHADGIGFHVFPEGTLNRQFDQVAQVRRYVTEAGAPNSLPLYGTEVGWTLGPINEAQRAERYEFVTERMPSSNCNIDAMYAHAWTTSPPGGIVYDHDAGIADRDTGSLFPSGVAFRDAIGVLSGRGKREALHPDLHHCAGMSKLDRDGDKRAEHRDYYPFDASRWQGPPGWYTGVAVDAKRKQKLGRKVVATVFCEEACRAKVTGKVALRGAKGKRALKLKPVRKRLKASVARRIVLKPTPAALRRIERSDANKGKAKLKAASIVDDERFEDATGVKLR